MKCGCTRGTVVSEYVSMKANMAQYIVYFDDSVVCIDLGFGNIESLIIFKIL